MSQRVHICLCAVMGFQDLSEPLGFVVFALIYFSSSCNAYGKLKWGGIKILGVNSNARRTESRGKSCVPAQPSSECSDRHNLFYAFNLGGLVTYIPSSHLFAFYGWTLLPSALFAFFYLTQYTHFGYSSEFSQAVKCSKSTNRPSALTNQCAGRFTRANNLRALWNI